MGPYTHIASDGSSRDPWPDKPARFTASPPPRIIAGFECSTHRRPDGKRLDLLESTGHARFARGDFERLRGYGINTVRDGIRWHLVAKGLRQYDWDSFLPMLRASRATGMQVIWDLFHYGWPDHLDVWSPQFVDSFAHFARSVTRLLRNECDHPLQLCPINEISYLAWAGGECEKMNPFTRGRGSELKRQLVRAFLAAVQAIRAEAPSVRILTSEPLINVVGHGGDPSETEHAELYRRAQYETVDMLLGRSMPQLGGSPAGIDVIGVNYYPDNQWYHGGSTIPFGHHAYRPLSDMLGEVYARYGLPLAISETGAERSARACWLRYVCMQVRRVGYSGVPVESVCLYPILDYPGWDDGRQCEAGLLSLPSEWGSRDVDEELLCELNAQTSAFAALHRQVNPVGSAADG